jgi:hypothetical protein
MSGQIPDLRVGVWRAVGELKLRQLLWPEGLPSIAAGVGGGVLAIQATATATRVSAISSLIVLSGALLAICFTALAIVVSLPSSRYLRAMSEGEGGMRVFLDPFLVAVGTQLAIILLALAYQLFAEHVARPIEHVSFCLLASLFVFGLLDIAALARSLVKHGILRSLAAASENVEDEHGGGDVRPIRGGRKR